MLTTECVCVLCACVRACECVCVRACVCVCVCVCVCKTLVCYKILLNFSAAYLHIHSWLHTVPCNFVVEIKQLKI